MLQSTDKADLEEYLDARTLIKVSHEEKHLYEKVLLSHITKLEENKEKHTSYPIFQAPETLDNEAISFADISMYSVLETTSIKSNQVVTSSPKS